MSNYQHRVPLPHPHDSVFDWASAYATAKRMFNASPTEAKPSRKEILLVAAGLLRMMEREPYSRKELEELLGPPTGRRMRTEDLGCVTSVKGLIERKQRGEENETGDNRKPLRGKVKGSFGFDDPALAQPTIHQGSTERFSRSE